MTWGIPHRICVITEQIDLNQNDYVFLNTMKMVFDWANKMGLDGKSVFGLSVKQLDNVTEVSCYIKCTEKEYKKWEQRYKLDLDLMVHGVVISSACNFDAIEESTKIEE